MLEGTTILQSMDVRTSLRPNLYRPNEAIKPSFYMAIKAPVVPYADNYCPRIANDNQQRDNSLRSCFAHKDQLQSMPHHH